MNKGILYLRLKEIKQAFFLIKHWDITINSRYGFCKLDLTDIEKEIKRLECIFEQSQKTADRYVNGVRKPINRLKHKIIEINKKIDKAQADKLMKLYAALLNVKEFFENL